MKLKITTLVIVEEGQVQDIYQMKKKSKYTYHTRINGMNTFLLQVNQTNKNTYT